MADSDYTLTNLVKINDANARDLGVSDILDDAPFLKVLFSTVASNGTSHKYLKETTAPVVGFRAVNAGRDNSVSADTLVSIDLAYLDATFAIDVAIVRGYSKGVDAFLAREAKRHIKASFKSWEKQVINGTTNDSDGFSGFKQALAALGGMTIGAGGTTANTASSVYMIRTNADETDVMSVIGNNGNIVIGESSIQRVEDADGQYYNAYITDIGAYAGLQVGSAYSISRLANLTADSGKGLTDTLLYAQLLTFQQGRPDYIVMNTRSIGQLRTSRTATNATGAPAPLPTEFEGIPIIVTNSITNTEALIT